MHEVGKTPEYEKKVEEKIKPITFLAILTMFRMTTESNL